MKKMLGRIAILASVALLGACATFGELELVPLTYADGERVTLGVHHQPLPDWMMDQSKLKINFLVKGDATPKQLAAIAVTERGCQIYADKARPNDIVAVLSSGVLYAAAGWAGVGLGARAFLSQNGGIKTAAYARYGADASAFSGAANGIISSKGGKSYTFKSCSREALDAVSSYGVKVIIDAPVY